MTPSIGIRGWLIGSGMLLVGAGGPLVEPLDAQDEGLTLQECVTVALDRNPLIRSARKQYQASRARVRQAWSLPQPSFFIDSDLQPGLTDFRKWGERYLGFSQSLPFPGKIILDGQIARRESEEALTDVAILELDVGFQVKEAFYGLLLAEEKVNYSEQNLELSRDFVEKTEVKYQAGDVPQVEVLRARVEAARAATDVGRAESEVSVARARLEFLLARSEPEPLRITGELKTPPITYGLDQLTGWALSYRPEVEKINLSLAKASLAGKLAYMSYLPDLDVGAAQHHLVGEDDTWDVTLSLSVPLFFWQPASGEIAEARATHQALEEEATHLANAISLEVEEAYRGLTTAANQIQVMEDEIISQAEQVYRMYQFAYQQGEIGGIELIEARRTLNEVRLAYADALFEYDVALAAIERSIGRTLGEN